MPNREIPRDQLTKFLDEFSKQHENWIAYLEIVSADLGDQQESDKLPLVGISADLKAGQNRIAVMVGGRPEAHLTHFIERPKRVWIEQSDDPRHDAIAIEDDDGGRTIVHFRHYDPDEVDRILPGQP